MEFNLAISPCPNDTFMFDALINRKIDLQGFNFKVSYHDISALNEAAFSDTFDISKLSSYGFFSVIDKYRMLNSGSALGFGVGPIMVALKGSPFNIHNLSNCTIGLPGHNTTANFMFSYAFPEAQTKFYIPFNNIEQQVVEKKIDVGVLIHEGRFTYSQKGLVCLADLGDIWYQRTSLPIPLGCIALKRKYSNCTAQRLSNLVKSSVAYALNNPKSSLNFVTQYAQEMDPLVINQHIKLYVNEFSLELDSRAYKAIRYMRQYANANLNLPKAYDTFDIFNNSKL